MRVDIRRRAGGAILSLQRRHFRRLPLPQIVLALGPSLSFTIDRAPSAAILERRIADLYALWQRAPRAQTQSLAKRIRANHLARVRLAHGYYEPRNRALVLPFAPDGAIAPDGMQWRYFRAAMDDVRVWAELHAIGAELAPRAGVDELVEREYERLYPLMDGGA